MLGVTGGAGEAFAQPFALVLHADGGGFDSHRRPGQDSPVPAFLGGRAVGVRLQEMADTFRHVTASRRAAAS